LYIEYWLHKILKATLETEPEYRRFANKSDLNQISRSDVETYQSYRLQRILQYCCDHSSFYRESFASAGLRPENIRDPRELVKLPFTEPRDLAEVPYRFLCTSQSEIARPHTFVTSGTTGPRKKVFWTRRDLERITDFMSAGIGMVATQQDVVQINLPDGRPNSQADLLFKGVKKFGATPVLSGMDLGAQEFLNVVADFHSTIIFGYTRRLFRLSKELQLKQDLRGKGVRVLFLAAEYLPIAMRKELEKIWNCRIHTHYGLTEMGLGVAVECSAGNGYHFNEADLLLEVVNPRTGERVPPGEEGELVFTTLNREAMPLIRYRTHDVSRLIAGSCPCGASTLLRIDTVRKRLDSILEIGDGDEICPTYFDDTLFEVPGLIDYQMTVTKEKDKDRLDFKIEMISKPGNRSAEIKDKLLSVPIVAKNIAAGRMVAPRIDIVGWGALQSVGRAKKMIIDCRQQLPVASNGN
jgi:phenylacetate-CoA ligase